MQKYAIVNAGSSSLKFSLYEVPEMKEIVNVLIEKIGESDSSYTLKYDSKKEEKQVFIKDHSSAVDIVIEELLKNNFINSTTEIKAIGHRVLHGGEIYSNSCLIDDSVIKNIQDLTPLGPLHHPSELACINTIQEKMPNVYQVAVFDTAFHQTMPKENYIYPVPFDWYKENNVRKYGFHGTSHKYITEKMKVILNKEDVNLIICHIGSGASISCVKEGKCFDTTMGLTPLDGLMMGTRSGSIDPSIIKYIMDQKGYSIDEVMNALNKKSGLFGICDKNDFRDITSLVKSGNEKAKLAYDMFVNSTVKFIAQYYFELNGKVDSIVFTAGVGENAKEFREDVVNKIAPVMNLEFSKEANNRISRHDKYTNGIIALSSTGLNVCVLPTNEEEMILKDTYNIVKDKIKVKRR